MVVKVTAGCFVSIAISKIISGAGYMKPHLERTSFAKAG